MKRITLIAAAATAVLLLAGCGASAPTSVATNDYAGFPAPHEDTSGGAGGDPQAFWLDANRSAFAVVTFGSSSCPGIPTVVTRSSDKEIGITITQDDATKACTADFVPWTFEFATPKDIADSGTVEAKILFDFGSTRTVVVEIQD